MKAAGMRRNLKSQGTLAISLTKMMRERMRCGLGGGGGCRRELSSAIHPTCFFFLFLLLFETASFWFVKFLFYFFLIGVVFQLTVSFRTPPSRHAIHPIIFVFVFVFFFLFLSGLVHLIFAISFD